MTTKMTMSMSMILIRRVPVIVAGTIRWLKKMEVIIATHGSNTVVTKDHPLDLGNDDTKDNNDHDTVDDREGGGEKRLVSMAQRVLYVQY
mmetsp:Transcript_24799/g.26671  ORF Transcript_24799/g.26671 Transcript_24799/m.26671 type:complete len:90 (+) Transcript_24799:3-272(+)